MPSDIRRRLSPSAQDSALARVSGQHLARLARRDRSLRVHLAGGERDEAIELPAGAVALLIDILDAMAAGRGVKILHDSEEITTVQAAELLKVSRPYFIGLLEAGAIPFRKVGKHRRVRTEDVISYKERIDREREDALDELAALAQKHDLGYGPL